MGLDRQAAVKGSHTDSSHQESKKFLQMDNKVQNPPCLPSIKSHESDPASWGVRVIHRETKRSHLKFIPLEQTHRSNLYKKKYIIIYIKKKNIIKRLNLLVPCILHHFAIAVG